MYAEARRARARLRHLRRRRPAHADDARAQGAADRRIASHAARQVLHGHRRAPRTRASRRRTFQGDDYFERHRRRASTRIYQERLEAQNGVDFGELILKALMLVREGPEDRPAELAQRFEHVLVDEFQDTNRVQYRLVQHLSSSTRQHLRGRRRRPVASTAGAAPTCATSSTSSTTTPAPTSSSWSRTTAPRRNILDARQRRHRAQPARARPSASSPSTRAATAHRLRTGDDERDEADFVVRAHPTRLRARRAARRATSPCSTAPTPSRACWKRRCAPPTCPYIVIGGTRFYDRAEVKDLLAYLRVVANPADEVVAASASSTCPPRGIGDTTIEKCVRDGATSGGSHLFEAHAADCRTADGAAVDRAARRSWPASSRSMRRAARLRRVDRPGRWPRDGAGAHAATCERLAARGVARVARSASRT